MPIVTITIRAGRPENEIQALMLSVHQALEEAFAITAADRNQRLVEIKAEHFFFPKRSTEAYTSIEIASFPGRSAEAKEQLFQAIYTRLGQSPITVLILFFRPVMPTFFITTVLKIASCRFWLAKNNWLH